MSRETLRAPFFDDLWPLILDWNRCATDYTWTKGTTEFYEPQRNFDDLAVHEYLAKHGYDDYVLPEKVSCFKKGSKDTAKQNTSSATSSISSLSTSECLASSTSAILTTANGCKWKWFGKKVPRPTRNLSRVRWSCINYLRKQRSLLKDKQRTVCADVDEISKDEPHIEEHYEDENEMPNAEDEVENKQMEINTNKSVDWFWEDGEWRETFYKEENTKCQSQKEIRCTELPNAIPTTCAFEDKYEETSKFVKTVLESMVGYDAKCIFLYIGQRMDISEMERWWQLKNKAQIITLTASQEVASQVQLLGTHFHAYVIDKEILPADLSYQNELEYVINCGLKYSLEKGLLKYSGDIFIFVFAKHRDEDICNNFCVMKRI